MHAISGGTSGVLNFTDFLPMMFSTLAPRERMMPFTSFAVSAT